MRVLAFATTRRYEMFYEGLITINTSGAETRTLGKILTKLENVGRNRVNAEGKEILLFTCEPPCVVELEDAEYTLAKSLLDKVEWSGLGAREAGALLEWMDTLPTKEQYEAQKDGVLKVVD